MQNTQLTGTVLTINRKCLTQPVGKKAVYLMAALMMSTSLSAVISPTVANAQTSASERNFSIRSQSLSTALLEFSNASGIDIFFDQKTIGNRSTQGLTGRYTPKAGLEKLLAGTGLSYNFNNTRSITIIDRLASSPIRQRLPMTARFYSTQSRLQGAQILKIPLTQRPDLPLIFLPKISAGYHQALRAIFLNRHRGSYRQAAVPDRD